MNNRNKIKKSPYSGKINVHEFNDIYINEISSEIYRHELEPYPDYAYDEEDVNTSDKIKKKK